MRRTVVTIVGIIVLLFLILVFLNVCGREANATEVSRRVRLNRISSSHLVVGSPQQLASRAGDCKRAEASYVFENYLGHRLFAYTLVGRWCFDGERVTWRSWSDHYSIGGQVYNVWAWRGEQDPNDTGGVGQRYVFRRINGTFGLDIAWYHKERTVYVQGTLRGDGTSTFGKDG